MSSSARNPIALVTGGRRGIGAAIAQALAGRGFDVAIADLERDENAERTLAAIKAMGRRAEFLLGDIADIASHDALLNKVWDSFGTLDCLVNNAGAQVKVRGDMLDVTPGEFDRLHNVNLRGTFFLTQAAAKRMTKEKRTENDPHRSIVTLSSCNAFMPSTNRAEYCISKSGLSMVNKLWALRLAEDRIHCYEIQPGVIETDMTAPAKERYDQLIAQGVFPIARWGQVGDIAGTVATLASGGIPFSTGAAFAIDGGLHIQKL